MSRYGRLIGAGLGFAFGGPIGAILGLALGYAFDKKGNPEGHFNQGTNAQLGDFEVSLLILSAAVMNADGKVLKSELDYVKQFLKNQFGADRAKDMLPILREILKQDISVRQVGLQIRSNMPHAQRLQLVHYLFGIATSDGEMDQSEQKILATISHYLGLSQKDFHSIAAMFKRQNVSTAYEILEIDSSATDSEVKKAYRKMAVKYHPDKVAQLGEEVKKAAKEKFQKVQEAYEQIKKQRGLS